MGSRAYVLNGRLAGMVGKSRRVYVLNGRLAGTWLVKVASICSEW